MQIYLLLTEKCNLHCAMCIRGSQEGKNLSYDELKKILEVQSFRNHDVVLTGGEPSLHKDFVKIIRLMCRNANKVAITTNGIFNDYLKDIADLKNQNLMFQISVDGDEICHNKIRGKGTFQKTMKTVELVAQNSFIYSIATVVNADNMGSMFELRKIIETLPNLKHWKLSYEMPFGDAALSNSLQIENWNFFVDRIIANSHCKLFVKKLFPFDLYDRNMDKLNDLLKSGHRFTNCGSGKNKLYVYPDFNVYPCTCLKDFCVGNLKIQTLEEILADEKIRPFSNYKIDSESQCNDCKYKKFCNGGCIGMSYHKFKKLGMGDVRCPKLSQSH